MTCRFYAGYRRSFLGVHPRAFLFLFSFWLNILLSSDPESFHFYIPVIIGTDRIILVRKEEFGELETRQDDGRTKEGENYCLVIT